MQTLLELVRSLDRCPHGRHEGESCAGWKGPGSFDGGCLGGASLGNPYLQTHPPGRIGTDTWGFPITLADLSHAAGIDHSTQYGVGKADGTTLVMTSDDGGQSVPATLEQARDEVRRQRQDDPFAHVVEFRRCDWTDSVAVLRIPSEE